MPLPLFDLLTTAMTDSVVPSTIHAVTTGPSPPEDPLWERLRTEAEEALAEEPELCTLFHRTVLAPGVNCFEDAIARTVCYRLLQQPCIPPQPSSSQKPVFCPNSLYSLFRRALQREDALARRRVSRGRDSAARPL